MLGLLGHREPRCSGDRRVFRSLAALVISAWKMTLEEKNLDLPWSGFVWFWGMTFFWTEVFLKEPVVGVLFWRRFQAPCEISEVPYLCSTCGKPQSLLQLQSLRPFFPSSAGLGSPSLRLAAPVRTVTPRGHPHGATAWSSGQPTAACGRGDHWHDHQTPGGWRVWSALGAGPTVLHGNQGGV